MKEQNTMTNSSQNSFLVVAALAGALSMTTTQSFARDEEHPSMSITMRQTYDYFSTYVQETRYMNPNKKSFRERYTRMVNSEWFKKTYDNKSVGDIIEVDY